MCKDTTMIQWLIVDLLKPVYLMVYVQLITVSAIGIWSFTVYCTNIENRTNNFFVIISVWNEIETGSFMSSLASYITIVTALVLSAVFAAIGIVYTLINLYMRPVNVCNGVLSIYFCSTTACKIHLSWRSSSIHFTVCCIAISLALFLIQYNSSMQTNLLAKEHLADGFTTGDSTT
jgi:hypothetical protein